MEPVHVCAIQSQVFCICIFYVLVFVCHLQHWHSVCFLFKKNLARHLHFVVSRL